MKTTPLYLSNIILLKEKRGMRESIPRQVDKKFGVSKERGVWNSQGEGKDKLFFYPPTFFSLSHIKHFLSLSPELRITQQTTQFKLY